MLPPEDGFLKDITQSGGSSAGQIAKSSKTTPRTPELKPQPTEDGGVVSEEADKASATKEVVPEQVEPSLSQLSEEDD